MLHASYEVWGVAIAVVLIGCWTIKRLVYRKKSRPVCGSDPEMTRLLHQEHDVQHQALMFLMTQKTESMLAALAQTIERERQKLGVVVRNPSMREVLDAFPPKEPSVSDSHPSAYERILPMAQTGMPVSTIARQLQLPEAEICMVMRLNTA